MVAIAHRMIKRAVNGQQTVNRYLMEFEGLLRQAESRDPSGQLVQGQLVSEMGRAYLLLAHASGRLS